MLWSLIMSATSYNVHLPFSIVDANWPAMTVLKCLEILNHNCVRMLSEASVTELFPVIQYPALEASSAVSEELEWR